MIPVTAMQSCTAIFMSVLMTLTTLMSSRPMQCNHFSACEHMAQARQTPEAPHACCALSQAQVAAKTKPSSVPMSVPNHDCKRCSFVMIWAMPNPPEMMPARAEQARSITSHPQRPMHAIEPSIPPPRDAMEA